MLNLKLLRNTDVASDVCLGCSCCPSAGAEFHTEVLSLYLE